MFKKVCFILIQIVVIVSQSIQARTVVKENHSSVFSVYEIVEISLSVSEPSVQNPFTEVSVSAVFTAPSADEIQIKGFCDSNNGSLYRLRFTPALTGTYSYEITYQDPLGSEHFSGQFNVNSGGARNGFITADPEYPTRFKFTSGGHPFICSKTAWLIAGIPENTYKGFLDKMVPRKENCIRFGFEFDYSTESPYIDVWPWAGTRSNPDYSRFDVSFWRNVDNIIEYAAQRDIYSECVIFTSQRTTLEWTHAQRYLDYILARLACYPSIILFQTNNEYNSTIDSKSYLIQVADYIHQNDPYDHLVAPAHRSTTDAAWADEDWVDVAINHWAKYNKNSLLTIYDIATRITKYGKPAWCDETAREDRHSNNSSVHRRKQYWTWNMAGVYWSFHSWEGSEGILDLTYNGPGYEYEPFIRPFWEKTEFWKMLPNNNLIRNDPPSLYERCIASDEEIVIYMCNGPDNPLTLADLPDNYTDSGPIRVELPDGIFNAEFYNPSNGQYYTDYKKVEIAGGQNVTLTFPTFNHDLVIYISKTGEFPVTTADFSAQPLTGYAPLAVQFTNLSSEAHTYEWNFGDGSPHTSLKDPEHVYPSEGTYSVTLTATGTYGADTEVKTGYIEVKEKTVGFTDITTSSNTAGFSSSGYGHGVSFTDIDLDRLVDLFVSNAGGSVKPVDLLYKNQGSGEFLSESVIRGIGDEGFTHSIVNADFDSDGDPDAFFANQPVGADINAGRNRLYRNDGAGYYTDITELAGLPEEYNYTRGAVACDINNDGYPDIYAVNWAAANEMYINDGSGRLKREDRGANGAPGNNAIETGVTAADFDRDGDVDIYVCRHDAGNLLYVNDGTGYFNEDAQSRGVDIGGRSNGATFADIDNDGDLDLFVVNECLSGSTVLPLLNILINNGDGTFQNKSDLYGINVSGYSVLFGDVDNDADPDMALVRNNFIVSDEKPALYLNDGSGGFELIPGSGIEGNAQDARGGGFADIDNDGDMDLYIACAAGQNFMLRNDLVNGNHYIDILCEGPKGDYGGVGTKVSVYEPGHIGDNEYLLGYQEVVSNYGYLSQNQPALHFGLGQFSNCDIRIELIKTDGTENSVLDTTNIGADQVFIMDVFKEFYPPVIFDIQDSGDRNLTFTWSRVNGATGYHVYRDTSPDFVPDTQGGSNRVGENVNDQDPGLTDIQWTDTDIVTGDIENNYYYKITSVKGSEESAASVTFGEFDYELVTTDKTDFNEIALPLYVKNVFKANDLMDLILDCNSVARWNSGLQDYEMYVPGYEISNFSVEPGYPYYVNITTNSILTITGEIQFPVFQLDTTRTTDFNEIILTFDKTHIKNASALMADIPHCNSVARWNAAAQGYEQYIPGLVFTDFSTTMGYPYYVNVTENTTWPEKLFSKPAVTAKKTHCPVTSKAPHVVYGEIKHAGFFRFVAFLKKNPSDLLTDESPGCIKNEYYWIVQTANFKSGWNAGDIISIEFYDDQDQLLGKTEWPLTHNAYDYTGTFDLGTVPQAYSLEQNYPNPFNAETTIGFSLPGNSDISLKIYNTKGQLIRTLVDHNKPPGNYKVVWDGKNESGLPAASGTYLYVMKSNFFKKVLKAVLLK
ncbi:VCBS repeat-containing protein [candidate division KSB1 bacterium]|nr:VCBS repeat-containing protein [candidate division KSB1 bacterium]